ncbi:outer envelope protein 61 [Cynara cardunculus var. scolymus]|uniref:Peptidyl-prolyl cis-trans isomerase, FKBP-type n=1 Tax=Cynara cardunculus var. scolymus TaxID=59895 RepID=A0A103YFM3_CYNCS|nr:outer envelope protein 61 [Cynara cardunculus var. scolymus]KVI08216.1 Peptidyl-prolyl cis-trans isomerase, FKBP-type [Cynara cardunculus var. scolymus]
MFPGMMDPEMMRLAQEQMSRMSPADLSRIQQQMMSNPDLMRMATDSMKYMKPEDLRHAAEQLKSTRPDEMAEIGEKMANATPEELAAMRSRVDAQLSYELNAAQMLKKQGNELHSHGRFKDALEKYMRAKNNLKGVPVSKGGTLLLACSLNLMSCYLKTGQYDECIEEGTEVLASDARNVKALYRRGQAYKSLGQLEKAVSDLSKALEFSPDDETIADVLRDAKERLTEQGDEDAPGGIRIEEITDEEPTPLSENHQTSSSEFSERKKAVGKRVSSQSVNTSACFPTKPEYLEALKDDKESIRSFQNFMSQADPETMASLSSGKFESISPDMVKTASNVISKMPPEEFQKMLQMASSFQGENPLLNRSSTGSSFDSSNHGSGIPNVTPDMLKTANDMMSKMPAEELLKMFEMASSLNGKYPSSAEGGLQSNRNNSSEGQESRRSSDNGNNVESYPSQGFLNSRSAPQPSFPSPSSDIREQLKNPAMREMMSSMMKNMSPDMMANMSQQFGVKLSREDAERAQQAMSSLSPENLDRMMKWADRIQRAGEGAIKTKNWLLGRQGLVMALCMLVFAIFLHWLGYVGS